MKTILVLTSRFPYPVIGGDRLRIYEVCKELSKKYSLTLASNCIGKFVVKPLLSKDKKNLIANGIIK